MGVASGSVVRHVEDFTPSRQRYAHLIISYLTGHFNRPKAGDELRCQSSVSGMSSTERSQVADVGGDLSLPETLDKQNRLRPVGSLGRRQIHISILVRREKGRLQGWFVSRL